MRKEHSPLQCNGEFSFSFSQEFPINRQEVVLFEHKGSRTKHRMMVPAIPAILDDQRLTLVKPSVFLILGRRGTATNQRTQ